MGFMPRKIEADPFTRSIGPRSWKRPELVSVGTLHDVAHHKPWHSPPGHDRCQAAWCLAS